MPWSVVHKPPTADLWAGQTDEDELGMRYADADRVLNWAVDRGLSSGQTAARTSLPEPSVAHVLARYRATAFKREIPYRFADHA